MAGRKSVCLWKQTTLQKRGSLTYNNTTFMLCPFFLDNKVGNLLGLTLKLSNHCVCETAHSSSRWLLLRALLSHLLPNVPLVLQSSTAHLADKDQNVILKWQNLWIYAWTVSSFYPPSFLLCLSNEQSFNLLSRELQFWMLYYSYSVLGRRGNKSKWN